MENKNKMTVGIGSYRMELTEAELKRLLLLKNSEYMTDDLKGILGLLVEHYQNDLGCKDGLKADKCMEMVTTLHDAMKDYEFLASLKVESVFDTEATSS